MNTSLLKETFNSLFLTAHGHTVSAQARSNLHLSDTSFTYGEIGLDAFDTILKTVQPKAGEVFYDLGSGAGKAVMWAAMAYPFKKAIGVELLDKILDLSKSMLEKYRIKVLPLLDLEKQHQAIDFVKGDFCQYDFSDANVLFIHSTCFSNHTMNHLAQKFSALQPGSRIITVSKNISQPNLRLIGSGNYQMAWGCATAYIYQVSP